jgi:hypothetical protein
MARPDFTLKWAGSRLSIPAISAGNYAAGWDTYLGPLPPLGDDHDYVMNLQDSRAIWLGEQMLLAVGHEWQDDVSYDAYAVVRSPVNGQLYRSLVGSNLNNEPSVSGAQWALGVADSVDLLNAPITTVAAAGTINLTTGAPNTSQLAISGTGVNINGFTVAANRFFIVKMTGASNTLVNSASLVTGRGANIPVVAGDTFLMRSTAANTVEIVGGLFLVDRAIGSGQTLQSLLGSRAVNTTYTNSTGRTIFVLASINVASGSNVLLQLDGASIGNFANNGTGATVLYCPFPVKDGMTYRLQGGVSAAYWGEFR